jgi:tungstate transport system substrate-binding protein
MVKKLSLFLVLLLLAGLAVGCGQSQTPATGGAPKEEPAAVRDLILATTTSTYDSGFLNYYLPLFEEKYNYKVKVVSLGTGQALEVAKNGDADVVLVHAKKTELEMVEQGHFVDRHDVMYNDFIIVGPEADPVGAKGVTDINQLFAAFTDKKAPFISRGDDSGTHKKELSLWEAAGVSPAGGWYVNIGSGMGDTLRMADEKEGYTLTDRATYLSLRDKLELVIVFEGNPQLFNQYGIMAVNPANYPQINYEGAKLLIDFFISAEGQELAAGFKPFGDTLFFPNAK